MKVHIDIFNGTISSITTDQDGLEVLVTELDELADEVVTPTEMAATVAKFRPCDKEPAVQTHLTVNVSI